MTLDAATTIALAREIEATDVEIDALERARRPGNRADRRAVQKARARRAKMVERLARGVYDFH